MLVWNDFFALWFQGLHIVKISAARFLSHIFFSFVLKRNCVQMINIKSRNFATELLTLLQCFLQIISQKTFIAECSKIFIRVAKISKTYHLWSEKYVLNLFKMFPSTWITNSNNSLLIFFLVYHHKWDLASEWNNASEITHVEVKFKAGVILRHVKFHFGTNSVWFQRVTAFNFQPGLIVCAMLYKVSLFPRRVQRKWKKIIFTRIEIDVWH